MVMVIAAHPDDEVLGCGGTIAKHVDNGEIVYILIVSEGETSRQEKRDTLKAKNKLDCLKDSAVSASRKLGVKNIRLLNFPDNRLDSIDRLDLIKEIEREIYKISPYLIYVHHSGDLNIDHRRIHEAVITACRPQPGNCVKKLLSYEVASSTEWQVNGSGAAFEPNLFVDISGQLERKLEALKIYKSEMRDWPHSRSLKAVEHLNRWRGAQAGLKAAEAFKVLRIIE